MLTNLQNSKWFEMESSRKKKKSNLRYFDLIRCNFNLTKGHVISTVIGLYEYYGVFYWYRNDGRLVHGYIKKHQMKWTLLRVYRSSIFFWIERVRELVRRIKTAGCVTTYIMIKVTLSGIISTLWYDILLLSSSLSKDTSAIRRN